MAARKLSKTLQPPVRRRAPALPDLGGVSLRDWFGALPPALRQELMSRSAVHQLIDGEPLFLKGQRPAGLYGVVAGEVRASSLADDGSEVILFIFEPGSWLGLISAFDRGVSPADCRALGNTTIRLLKQADLDDIIRREPTYYRYFIELMGRWVRIALGLLEDQVLLSLPARLAKRLVWLSDTYGRRVSNGVLIDLHLPQEELGRLLGVSRQSVNKELRALQVLGCIESGSAGIVVQDRARLAAIASGRAAAGKSPPDPRAPC